MLGRITFFKPVKIKNMKILGLVVLTIFSVLITNAQENVPNIGKTEEFKGFYLGGTASTNGWGGEVKYIFTKRLTAKTGYETLNLSQDFGFSENDIDYDATLDYKTGGIFVLGDFNFTRNLYISTGVLFNSFSPKVNGYAVSDLQYGDITIPASMIGDFELTVTPELTVSPYGGLGIRSFFGKNKTVVLNTEVGFYYLGPPQLDIKATGLLSPTADPVHGQKEKLEYQFEQYKFYPVFKLNLAIKLF
jgi:hypothetical protein